VFERFTDRARRVVVLAQEEARMLRHNYIGTEHILLGLVREGGGVAAMALESLNISLEAVRQQVGEIIGHGQAAPTGHIPFTPRAKKVLELSLREALQLGHHYIGTEHILLGLIREGDGVAAQVLQKLGADLNRVRQTIIQLLSEYTGGEAAAAGGTAETTALMSKVVPADVWASSEGFPTCPTCRSSLAETLAVQTLELKAGDEATMVKMAYCNRCGTALGTIP
jgi:ATP-dependent Clp protease ATP-binding subunit ClpC